MPNSLSTLEATRSNLLQQIIINGDFRPGTVSPGSTGHQQFRILRKVKKDSVPNRFLLLPRLSKPSNRYRNIIGSNGCSPNSPPSMSRSAVCGLSKRIQRGGLSKKKKTAAVLQEVARKVQAFRQVVFTGQRKTGAFDLKAIEMAARDSVHRMGAAMLTGLLTSEGNHAAHTPCLRGQLARYHDRRSKQLLTIVGPVKLNRAYYLCPSCHQGQCPTDSELDVKGTECSPAVRRMMAMVGSESSFDTCRAQLELLANLKVTTKTVERQAEAIGADIAAQEQKHVAALNGSGISLTNIFPVRFRLSISITPENTYGK